MARQGALGWHVAHDPGVQLWVALPPNQEHAEPEVQYIGAERMPGIGPARLIVGAYGGATSPVPAPDAINYLLVTLNPGERWTYEPPAGHLVAWVALGKGALTVGERLSKGELAIFEKSETPLTFEGADDVGATFVLGSAVPHSYQLHLGSYSVHTSPEALAAGERHIRALKQRLDAAGNRRMESSDSTPVFRG